MDDNMVIEASNVSKMFLLGRRTTSLKDQLTGFARSNKDEFWAFQDVSVSVPRGSMLGVIGRNGSGKSTFLRTLCGVYRPTSGEVRVRGRVTALLELGAGFHPELTGRENVYMNGSVVGLGRDHMDGVMDEIIDMADIGSFIDAPLETFSSGMRARLGFAVSVQMEPEILLADEITAVGDIAFKEHGIRRLNELREGGTTIVQVSHNLSMMAKSCDQVLWLHHGETRRLGDPVEVIEEYKALANVDRSGRMIEGGANPKYAARRRQQLQVTESLAAADRHSTWFVTLEITDPNGTTAIAGAEAVAVVDVELPSPVSNPSIELRLIAAGGAATGFGFDSGPLGESLTGRATIRGHIPSLTLQPGRYNLRADVLSNGDVVATRHVSCQVEPAAVDSGGFVPLDSQWSVEPVEPPSGGPGADSSGALERST
jgi:lipopolysaccharide transport system ATP-binding protein